MLSLEFSFPNSWKEVIRTLRQEHLSILLIGRGNMLWISFENLEYWRVNYHPPKGRWLLGSHRLLFKKFGIWVSTWILRQPLFLQACPHRRYCIGYSYPQRYFFMYVLYHIFYWYTMFLVTYSDIEYQSFLLHWKMQISITRYQYSSYTFSKGLNSGKPCRTYFDMYIKMIMQAIQHLQDVILRLKYW